MNFLSFFYHTARISSSLSLISVIQNQLPLKKPKTKVLPWLHSNIFNTWRWNSIFLWSDNCRNWVLIRIQILWLSLWIIWFRSRGKCLRVLKLHRIAGWMEHPKTKLMIRIPIKMQPINLHNKLSIKRKTVSYNLNLLYPAPPPNSSPKPPSSLP